MARKEWTKQEYLNWANWLKGARPPEQREHDTFVINQVRRFDPQVADLVQANTDAVDNIVAAITSRLEPR